MRLLISNADIAVPVDDEEDSAPPISSAPPSSPPPDDPISNTPSEKKTKTLTRKTAGRTSKTVDAPKSPPPSTTESKSKLKPKHDDEGPGEEEIEVASDRELSDDEGGGSKRKAKEVASKTAELALAKMKEVDFGWKNGET